MITSEVIIVGGGPAGSTCAWKLRQQNVECLVLDKENFPRTKLCAGWITPKVVNDLEMDDYPHGMIAFDKLHIKLLGIPLKGKGPQYSIRRYQFDDWLLKRSGVKVYRHKVGQITQKKDYYIIDDQYRCKYLVGAGGTHCPVYHALFKKLIPRQSELSVVALEQEFRYDYHNDRCFLWFCDNKLPGYSWYVPKGNGYLNVGVGAFSDKLKDQGGKIRDHWQHLVERLKSHSLVKDYQFKPKGYKYYIRNGVSQMRTDNAFIIGDAVGLATRDVGEGIGPAVESAILAARAIAEKSDMAIAPPTQYSAIMPGFVRTLGRWFGKENI